MNLALAAGATLTALALFEVGVRALIRPSEASYGRLGGVELPRGRLLTTADLASVGPDVPVPDLVDGGLPVTRGDIWGIMRDDALLGYAPQENAVSARGWWQSNDLGARSRSDTRRARPEGRLRLLVFGDSFANGSRVPQQESWPYLLGERAPAWDVVNFGVDGYGLSQSLLRYRHLRDALEHDVVLLGFVPRANLLRDVNTLRTLMGWPGAVVVPRFALEDGELVLIRSPFEDRDALRRDVEQGSPKLLSHLRRHDALYFERLYQLPPRIGDLVGYKLLTVHFRRTRLRRLGEDALRPGSEPLELARAIVDAMAAEAIADGKRFVLLYVPLGADMVSAPEQEAWRRIAAHCPRRATCIDLLDSLPLASELDSGRDGTHYGPRTNARIAEVVARHLPGPR